MLSPEIRARIFARDGYRCRRCRKRARLTIDHIIPRTKGGTDDDENLRVFCLSCNAAKGDRDDPRFSLVLGAQAEAAIAAATQAIKERDAAQETYREAVHNAVHAGLAYGEIGAALGVSRQAVRQLFLRG
jgi:DNA-directed RNA polymerase specialized sigma24 family protein